MAISQPADRAAPAASALIEMRGLRLAFGGQTIFDGLDLTVEDGEFLCILGPSGCGKSTLLRIIGDLLAADAGSILVDGKPPRETWRDIAFVFQSPRLLPLRSARDNSSSASNCAAAIFPSGRCANAPTGF